MAKIQKNPLNCVAHPLNNVNYKKLNGFVAIDKTCALFFEIITNPQLFVADIRQLADIAHKAGVPLIADTTIVPFSTFHAADFGVDIEVVSSKKYISGGGTGLGGLLIDYGQFDWSQSPSPALQARTKRVGKELAFTARVKTELITNLGGLMTPQVAYMETLGLDTHDAVVGLVSHKRHIALCDFIVHHNYFKIKLIIQA